MIRVALLALAALVAGTVTCAAQSLSAGSSWRNQRGSVLSIATVELNGAFKGSFENKAPGFQCQDKFDVTGNVRGRQVIFYVTFKNATQNCDTVTIWRGAVRGSRLSTQWDLAYPNPKTGRLRLLKGSDSFSRM